MMPDVVELRRDFLVTAPENQLDEAGPVWALDQFREIRLARVKKLAYGLVEGVSREFLRPRNLVQMAERRNLLGFHILQ